MSRPRFIVQAAKRLRTQSTAQRAASTSTSTSDGSPSPSTSLIESWQRPISEGSNPAYDHALQYLTKQSEQLIQRASRLRAQAEKLKSNDGPHGEIRGLVDRAFALEMKAKVNDPRVRWAFEESEGKTDVEDERDVFGVLAKEKWVEKGGLDLLMQRITTMNIVPDLLPPFTPSMDMSIVYPSATEGAQSKSSIEPGQYLLPSQTIQPPEISVQSFMTNKQSTRYMTLVMVDSDRPDPASYGFCQYVHWIVPNIPVDSSTTTLPTSSLPSLLPYQPPHPSPLTPYHRYTFLLLNQPSPEPLSLSSFSSPSSRSSFDIRTWLTENGFKDVKDVVKGAGIFREGGKKFGRDDVKGREAIDLIEREEKVVEGIYKDVLGEVPPVWMKAPKAIKYGTPSERASVEKLATKLSSGVKRA